MHAFEYRLQNARRMQIVVDEKCHWLRAVGRHFIYARLQFAPSYKM